MHNLGFVLTDAAELSHVPLVGRQRFKASVIGDRIKARVFTSQNRAIQRSGVTHAIAGQISVGGCHAIVTVVLLPLPTAKSANVQPAPNVGGGRIRRRMRGSAGIGRPLRGATSAADFHAIWDPGRATDELYVFFANFLIEYAVEEEDEEPLE